MSDFRCYRCGANRDYIRNTKTGFRCVLCGNKWERLNLKVKEETAE